MTNKLQCLSRALLVAQLMSLAMAVQGASTAKDSLLLFSLEKKPPIIDGSLNDECWTGAQTAVGFLPLGKVKAAKADTEVMSCYDDENLYFAAKVAEPNLGALKVSPATPYRGDCIELYLDPQNRQQNCFRIVVDSQGNHYTTSNDGVERPSNLKMSVRCGRSATSWTAEIAIPFASLNAPLPNDNQRWGFNVGRQRYADPPQENSSWAALDTFAQRDKYGKLAFYSRWEVPANLEYWKKSDRDPLLMRTTVSGYEIARAEARGKRPPSLWTYEPFLAEREESKAWKSKGSHDGHPAVRRAIQERYLEFYRASQGINRFLISKAKADDRLTQLRRLAYYCSDKYAAGAKAITDASSLLAALEKESSAIDDEMNAIYQIYGGAADAQWNKDLLGRIDDRIGAVSGRITAMENRTTEALARIGAPMRHASPWKSVSLEMPAGERIVNSDGANCRFSFSGWGFPFPQEEPYCLLTPFEVGVFDWRAAVAKQLAPGKYVYEYLDNVLSGASDVSGFFRSAGPVGFGIHDYWMPLLEEKIKTDPDIIVRSQDGLVRKSEGTEGRVLCGANPNNPTAMAHAEDYLKSLASHVAPSGKIDFFVTAWESHEYLILSGKNGETIYRSLGYNQSGKDAFRDYLKDRYTTIETLNRRWHTSYPSFASIEPPDDRHIKPAAQASGLTFEFERWQRVNHVRYVAKLRQFLKAGAPQIPVMEDASDFLWSMNGYLMFKENAADIYSFHWIPRSVESAMWTYLSTMRRKFGKELGYYENYWEQCTLPHFNDERLTQRDVRKFFFDLLIHDIRYSTWWLSYWPTSFTTDYLVVYGGGFFGLDYDQTILRWSSTELAPMFARCRNIEKAILESSPEVPKTAVIQPCTTIFTMPTLGSSIQTISDMFAAHNQMLAPGNYPHDYLPEEMVLDGNASLDDYTLLVLPYAPYMTERFSKMLIDWTNNGGTLVAFGPFGLSDEFGFELPREKSLFKTCFPKIQRTGTGDWDYGPDGKQSQPAIEVKKYGKGTLTYLNRDIGTVYSTPSLRKPLEALLAAVGQRMAISPDADLRIMVRRKAADQTYLCLCNNNVEKPIETMVTVKGKYSRALDIVVPGWFPVPLEGKDNETRVRIRLDPGDFTLIELTP